MEVTAVSLKIATKPIRLKSIYLLQSVDLRIGSYRPQVSQVFPVGRQESCTKPTTVKKTFSALQHIELLASRFAFNLQHKSIETALVLHSHGSSQVLASMQTEASKASPFQHGFSFYSVKTGSSPLFCHSLEASAFSSCV